MRHRLLSAAAALLATLLMIPLGLGAHADAAQAADGAAAPVTLPALTGWQPTAAGGFRLTRTSRVLVPDAALRADAGTFVADLAELTGRRLAVVVTSAAPRTGDIVLRLDAGRSDLKSEGYALSVGRSMTVTGRTTTGTFWGTRTLLQVLRPGTAVPAGHVTDVPAYAERGIGVCACYIHVSMPWLERTIKDASYLKLNQLQLELKVKSTAQPEANQWGYYTPAEITELQKVADTYHVTLVPEVNSPGHIDPWIANRPDLQLTDSSGVKQPTRLDITKPEAFDFLTSIIDEYFKVFRTPYWHMGADEYMIGSDYSKYPQIAAYAKQKFGPNAVPQDAYNDFINRVDDYVKAKGKTLRMWNDGISSAATVPLHPDIVVEHWLSSDVKPSKIIADGQQVENAAYSLYNVRGGFKSDTAGLYAKGWNPKVFEGETLSSSDGVTGAKISLWPDNGQGNTENEIQDEIRMSTRFVAQTTWGVANPDPTYAGFEARADAVGRAPGFDNTDRTPVPAGSYRLRVGGSYLTAKSAGAGAPAVLGSTPTTLRLTPTSDGYYTVQDAATGRCLETRQNITSVNSPLTPGTALTFETCSADDRLQRWQLVRTSGGVTLTAATTQMIAVVDGGALVQQVPDEYRAQAFGLVGAVDTTAAASDATVLRGQQTTVTETVRNGSSVPVTGLSAALTAPSGWTAQATSPTTASRLAPGATFRATWSVTPTDAAASGAAVLSAAVSYTSGGQQVTETRPVSVHVERSAHYVFSQSYDGPSYKRLTRQVTVPAGGGSLSFWADYDTEQSWDYLFVEAHTPGQDDWTTLPDTNGHTATTPGDSCANDWATLHPQMAHYQTYNGGTCTATGTTGAWNAATGSSGGWQQWSVDLSAWAGRSVELSISYASDWGGQGKGVWLDDATLPDGTTAAFEDGLDGWTVAGAPTGEPANPNDYGVVSATAAPAP